MSYIRKKLNENTDYFKLNQRQLRNSEGKLDLPSSRFSYCKNTIFFEGVKAWNELPSDLRNEHDIPIFRTNLKQYLLNTQSN